MSHEPEPGPQQEPYGLTDTAQQTSGADEAAKPASILPAATFPEGTGAAQSHVAASETGKQPYTADPSGYGLSEEPTNQPAASGTTARGQRYYRKAARYYCLQPSGTGCCTRSIRWGRFRSGL